LESPDLRITGVLCTFFDNTNVARDVSNILRQRYEDQVFETAIPKNVKVEEAHSRRLSVIDYAPDSKGAQAYKQLIKEVIDRG
jgi:chromosome partitioning protein